MAVPGTSPLSLDWDEIATSTLRNRAKKLSDNFTRQTALFDRLKKKGNVQPFSGGRSIMRELVYAANATTKRYSGYESLDIRPQQVFTGAEFLLKQAAVAVTMSGLEMLTNSGPNAIIDLMETRIKNAERSLLEMLASDAYSDGTADGGKQMGGLALLVSDAGTGTVGNINSSTWSFWRNQKLGFSADLSTTASSTTIQTAMNRMYLNLVLGSKKPDLIIADNTYFRYYWESLQAIQRITNANDGEAGFDTLKFMGADVVADGGSAAVSGYAPSNHMYFLNTNHIYYQPHKDRNFDVLNPTRYAVSQDALVKLIGWAGQMTIDNRRLQGVIVA